MRGMAVAILEGRSNQESKVRAATQAAGELERDWMHSVLHVAYGPLSIAGWFIDGLAMPTAYRLPLKPADNLFHLLLTVAALATVVLGNRTPPRSG